MVVEVCHLTPCAGFLLCPLCMQTRIRASASIVLPLNVKFSLCVGSHACQQSLVAMHDAERTANYFHWKVVICLMGIDSAAGRRLAGRCKFPLLSINPHRRVERGSLCLCLHPYYYW